MRIQSSSLPHFGMLATFIVYIVMLAEEVTKLLKGFNSSKAFGPGEIHPCLEKIATEFGPVFALLLQQSYDMRKSQRSGLLPTNAHCTERLQSLYVLL